jgi:hypothetical protein
MSLLVYTIQDFERIKANGFVCTLPEQTMKIIQELSREVGSPNYVKTPVFRKVNTNTTLNGNANLNGHPNGNSNYNNKKSVGGVLNNSGSGSGTNIMWNTIRSFKATKIEQKTGIDGKIDLIRSTLNKLTDKNYLDFKEKMMEIMEGIVVNEESENTEDLKKVGNAIFEIASTNMFYSKLYADMYCELCQKYPNMYHIFENSFACFSEVFEKIEYADPNVDYDSFCKNNKINQKRRALSAFSINLMKNGVISMQHINDLAFNLFQLMDSYIVQENKRNEVDEIAENIAILCVTSTEKKTLLNQNEQITEKVTILSKVKVNSKEYPSLSSKSIFKFMEIIEKLDL